MNGVGLNVFLSTVEILCFVVYFADIYLKSFYQGFKTFVSKKWQKRLLVICFFLFADYLLPLWSLSAPAGFYLAPLRPGIMVCRHRETRQFFDLVLTLLPKAARLGVPIVFLIFMYSVVAFEFFGPGRNVVTANGILPPPDTDSYKGHLFEAYSYPLTAFYQLTVLMFTGDTFQDLAPTSNRSTTHSDSVHDVLFDVETTHGNILYVYFFTSFVLVASVLFVDLVLGSVYEAFHDGAEDQSKGSISKEMKGLIRAFQLLDITGSGTISEPMFIQFIASLAHHHSIGGAELMVRQDRAVATSFAEIVEMARMSERERENNEKLTEKLKRDAKLYFLMAAEFSGSTIDVVSFLNLKEVLSYRFSYGDGDDSPEVTRGAEKNWFEDFFCDSAPMCRKVMPYVLVADILCHLFDLQEITYSFGMKNWLSVSMIFDLFYVFDVFVRRRCLDHRQSPAIYSSFADYCSGVHLLACVIEALSAWSVLPGDPAAEWLPGSFKSAARVVYYTGRELIELLRVLRLVDINRTLHHYIDTLSEVVPVLYQCVLFVILIAYTYATCGFLFLGMPCGITALKSPSMAMKTTLTLFFHGLQDTLEASSSEASSPWVAPVVGLYFFGFHVIGVMVFLNVINAIIITFYSNAIAAREAKDAREETLEEIRRNMMTKLEDRKVRLQMILRKRAHDSDGAASTPSELASGGPKSFVQILATVQTFQNLTRQQLEHAAAKFVEERFTRGRIVVEQGDIGEEFYIIAEGYALAYFSPEATLDRANPLSGATEVGRLDEKQWFGEVALLKGERRSASIVAGSDLKVLKMSKTDFLSIVDSEKLAYMADRRAAIMSKVVEIDECLKGLEISKGDSLDSASLVRKLVVDPGFIDPVTGFFTTHKRVTLKELVACQKYAKGIDLRAAFFEKNHGNRAWIEVEHRFRMNLLRLRKEATETAKKGNKKGDKGVSKTKSTKEKEKELGRQASFRNAGDVVIRNGEPVTEVALVTKGALVVAKSSPRNDGNDAVSALKSTKHRKVTWHIGEIVGELAFLTRSTNTDGDIVAEVDDTEVIFVNLPEFLQMDRAVLSGFCEHIGQAHVPTITRN
jgi:CRP-like cAMP-binding protein